MIYTIIAWRALSEVSSLSSSVSTRRTLHYRRMSSWSSYQHLFRWSRLESVVLSCC